jgi:hypothetical protein
MSHEIEQLDFRWTRENDGYFAAAASPGARHWEDSLLPVARPPAMSSPTTVVYRGVGDEHAAVIFRCLLPSAGGAGSRAALAARAVVGPASLLTPGIALGCAALDVPTFLTPPVEPAPGGSELPRLSFADIQHEAADERLVRQLDRAARGWASTGELTQFLAAALAEPGLAVALQLRCRQEGRLNIAALLWGLWRLADPILGPGRDWAFSTGEKPLGNHDPAELPHVIVRDLDDDSTRPDMPRTEIVISQGQPAARAYPVDDLARRLVAAYDEMQATGPPEVLAGLAAGDSVQDRLGIVRSRLGMPADPVSGQDGHDPEICPPGQDQAAAHQPGSEYPVDYDDRPDGEVDLSLADWLTSPSSAAPEPDTFRRLLDGLAYGNPEAVRSLASLAAAKQHPGRRQRAALRQRAAAQGWYVKELAEQHPYDVETYVRYLLALLVEPDLDDIEVRQELADMMSEGSTSSVALLALDRLARDRSDYALWDDLVVRIVGRSWLADHGRYGHRWKLREPGPAHGAPRRALRWLPFKKENGRPYLLANACLYLAVAEMILCVVLVFR